MKSSQKQIETLSKIVDNIASHKECYNILDTKKRPQTKENLIQDGEKAFIGVANSVKEEAMYWYQLGRMYDCSLKYIEKAIDALKKASDLDPDSVDVWNLLGESYWNNMDVDMAKRCFEKALERSVNKISLRSLSVVTRNQSLKMKAKDKDRSLNDALVLAKRALHLDLKDGQSWTTLGNSYLAAFFNSPVERQLIHQAIACYSQAEKNLNSGDNFDVFYNKAVAYKYIENFSSSLDYLLQCVEGDSVWELPLQTYNRLIRYLDLIMASFGRKGRLKPKKYQSMLKDLAKYQLGPFSVKSGYKVVQSRDLKVDSNPTSIFFAKVLWTVEMDDNSFPVTLGLVDSNGDEIVVTLFNFNGQKVFFKVGDSIAIPNPQYESIDVVHREKHYRFNKVRVDNPTTLVVNNRVLPEFSYVKYDFETSPK